MKERDWNIIKLLSRKLRGQASAEEERRLDAWRQENARHQQLWDELFRPEACAENEQRLAAFPPEERWREVEDRLKASRPRRIGRWMRYAAAVVLAAGLVGGGWHYLHRPSDTKDQQICAIRTGPLVDFFETEFQRIHARTPEEYMDSLLSGSTLSRDYADR